MRVRKAVITAAGLGTRTLPASKAVPKVLLPVVDRPAIQYVVEEAARAGIRDVCIVVSPGQDLVGAHFESSPQLEAALERAGKQDLLKEIREIADLADLTLVVQEQPLGLGDAVLVARDFADGESVAILLADEIYDPADDFLRRMMVTLESEERSVVGVTEVSAEDIRLYGAIDAEDLDKEVIEVSSVVEKPDPSLAPSRLAVVGRYVVMPEIFDVLAELPPGNLGEIQLSDALDVLGRRKRLLAQKYHGRRWDIGRKLGYLEAIVTLGSEREDELGRAFSKFLSEFGSR